MICAGLQFSFLQLLGRKDTYFFSSLGNLSFSLSYLLSGSFWSIQREGSFLVQTVFVKKN